MKSGLLFIIFLLIYFSLLNSTTITVKPDGTGDYSEIQAGIDASTDGDIVLVYPGIYYENLVISGKDITLASLEYTTGDESYISQTIIDGNLESSCIRMIDESCTVQIEGFILTNGLGYQRYIGKEGGAILIGTDQNVTIKQCKFYNNYAEVGGALFIASSNLFISGTDIYDNYANTGGAIFFNAIPNVTFDTENLCNIYNNCAGCGRDIFAGQFAENINVVVDTFTVMNPDSYYACHLNEDSGYHFSFDIQHSFIEPVSHDFYVAADGNDENSGLSPDQPLQTINRAMQIIASDSLNPRTIHVAPGTYSQTLNNQFFPIGMKSYVTLEGDENDRPVLVNDGIPETSKMFFSGSNQNYSLIINFILHQNSENVKEIIFDHYSECGPNYSNITMENMNLTSSHASIFFEQSNLQFINNEISNITTSGAIGPDGNNVNMIIKNCLWENNHSTNTGEDSFGFIGPCVSIVDSLLMENCRLTGNVSTADVSSMISISPSQFDHPKIVLKNVECTNNRSSYDSTIFLGCPLDYENEIEKQIINCTFSDNITGYYPAELIGKTRVTNSIFYNNEDYEIYLPDLEYLDVYSELTVDHCLIKNGYDGIYNQHNINTINWLNGNIDADPLFSNDVYYPFSLAEGSPCIDAGTLELPEGLTLPEYDLAGNPRIVGSSVDIGAYEYQDNPFSPQNEVPKIRFTRLKIYPNPFRIGKSRHCRSNFKLDLAEGGNIEIAVYNVKGQKVAEIMNAKVPKGIYRSEWNGKDNHGEYVANGIYFCKVTRNGKRIAMKKMTIVKR